MKVKLNKLTSAVIVALGLAAAAPASAIVVGGVDFGALGAPPFNQNLETATFAETLITGSGQLLTGYGNVTTVNGDSSYCGGGDAACLYFVFYNYTSQTFNNASSPPAVNFTGGFVDIYRNDGASNINLLNQSSPANLGIITGLTPWVRLTGHTFFDPTLNAAGGALAGDTQTLTASGTLTGASISNQGQGLLDVTGGFGLAAVAAFLNANTIGDNLGGFADLVTTSSANNLVLNPFDVAGGFATGCQTGQAVAGAWCLQGTLNARGNTVVVPEPATLALLGLSLLGIGASRRRWGKTAQRV